MSQVTQILKALVNGEGQASEKLLPLVYDELRRLAAQKLSRELPGQTLQATALVHEAYLRLVGDGEDECRWDNRNHFFAAAAEAMRRILVENARRRASLKHGGEFQRVELLDDLVMTQEEPGRLIEVDEALSKLAQEDATAAEVVKLHFFAGLPLEEVAELLDVSRATAYRHWAYARAWLQCEISGHSAPASPND